MARGNNRNSIRKSLKSCLTIFLTLFLSVFFIESYALVFKIVPNGSLPTAVVEGSSVPASYVIQNNTQSQRNNNFIKYLPPHVSIASDGCGPTFNLAPHGLPGDSCILNLIVSGSVNAKDPDPHHHLFACFPGGITCAGTPFPLNVVLMRPPPPLVSITISPPVATIVAGSSQQYIAIGRFADGSTRNITTTVLWHSSNTSVATINSTGLAEGLSAGNTNISASLGSVTSNTAILIVTPPPFVWVTNAASDNVTFCPVNPDGSLGTCNNTNAANVYSGPRFMAFNNSRTLAYVANSLAGTISVCPVNQNGTFGLCDNSSPTGPLDTNFGIALDPTNTFAYVTESTLNIVVVCPIGVGGLLGPCVDTTGTGFNQPLDIHINQAGTIAFIVNQGSNSISRCTINPGGTFGSCTTMSLALLNTPQGLTFNSTETRAWITNNPPASNVITCQVDLAGNFGPCSIASPPGLAVPNGIDVNADNSLAYVADAAPGVNAIFRCPILANGIFRPCVNSGLSGGTRPYGVLTNS